MLTTAIGENGKPHPNGIWLAWIKTHGALGPLRRRQHVRAERRDVRLALASRPSIVFVDAGTVTNYSSDDPSCSPHVYTAGQSFVDPGGDDEHCCVTRIRASPPRRSRCSSCRRAPPGASTSRLPTAAPPERPKPRRAGVDPPSSRPLRQQHTRCRPPASPRRIDPFVCRPGPSPAPTLAVRVRCRSECRLTASLRDYLECEPIERSSVCTSSRSTGPPGASRTGSIGTRTASPATRRERAPRRGRRCRSRRGEREQRVCCAAGLPRQQGDRRRHDRARERPTCPTGADRHAGGLRRLRVLRAAGIRGREATAAGGHACAASVRADEPPRIGTGGCCGTSSAPATART